MWNMVHLFGWIVLDKNYSMYVWSDIHGDILYITYMCVDRFVCVCPCVCMNTTVYIHLCVFMSVCIGGWSVYTSLGAHWVLLDCCLTVWALGCACGLGGLSSASELMLSSGHVVDWVSTLYEYMWGCSCVSEREQKRLYVRLRESLGNVWMVKSMCESV